MARSVSLSHFRPSSSLRGHRGLSLALVGTALASVASAPYPGLGAAGADPPPAPARITAESGQGKLLFTLTPGNGGYAVTGAGGVSLGTVTLEADRARMTLAGKALRYQVKRKESGFKLYREAGKGEPDVELAALKNKEGKFRIKDPHDRELFSGKVRDQKAKVAVASGARWVLKARPDGAEVEDERGSRLIRMRGLTSAPAAVFCAAPQFDVPQKAVVTAYCARFGP